MSVFIKRIYDPQSASDGYRILVDRLWPRGISKEKAALDLWFKDIAPSSELRKWFGHDPVKWPEFKQKYTKELKSHSENLETLESLAKKHTNITLLYGARDSQHNQATVIAGLLK